MEYSHLSNTVKIKTISENATSGVFEIEGLYTGYGLTIGNALRRTLLSSLPGAAVTQIKIKNVPHEFTTLPGVKEDFVEVSLNFKNLRFRLYSDEPQVLTLKAKGEKVITGADIQLNSQINIINPEAVIATLTSKSASFDAEITVERGLGYSAVETRKVVKLPIGTIMVDAFFSPVKRVNYEVENMRVGESTTYNRLKVDIETDGSISPSAAMHKASNILKDHFEKISEVQLQEFEIGEAPKPAKKSKK
ncbi:MAG: DNA-directed RNA polymerase subunit alpha [Patescibacteria group bacterium]|nr:DNA-directed RNA polymerase subunit alpha [Patescibacteria group bacterium]